MDYLIPFLVIGIASAAAFQIATTGLPHRNQILRVVAVAFAIRIGLCLTFYAFPQTRIFHEDAVGYERIGMRIAAYWHGDGPYWPLDTVSNYGYFYWNAVLYYLFGNYRLHASFANALIGCLTAIVLYRVSCRFFVEWVGRRAFYFALFFPSMIMWSSIAVKDTVMMFLLVLCMNSALRLKDRVSVKHALIVTGCLLAILTIRFYMFYMTALAIALSLTLFSGRRIGGNLANQLVLIGALALAFLFLGLRQEAAEEVTQFNLERVASVRAALASTANSGWIGEADVSSPTKAIAFIPYGIALLLFSPFPWQFNGLRPLLALPEMIVWWSLTMAWIRGFRYLFRSGRNELMPVLVFTIILTFAYSIVHGNVGIAFRQRSQIMIFLFLLAAVGQQLKKLRRQGLPDTAVALGHTPALAIPSAGLALVPSRPERPLPRSVRSS